MGVYRGIPADLHGAIEVFAAPAIMAAPFLLDFGQAAGIATVVVGALLLGLALSIYGQRRTVPLSAHAGFDFLLAITAIAAGIASGLATGDVAAAIFLVGVGVALMALTASTRFSAPRAA